MSRTGIGVFGVILAAIGVLVVLRLSGSGSSGHSGKGGPTAVEVAPTQRGAIENRRVFTGALEARSRVVIAANVGGRVEKMLVDLADPIRQGQVVAELDDAEETQGVAEAAAELAVTRANLQEAESALLLAERELERVVGLHKRGVSSESDLDTAKARFLNQESAVKVATAQLARATASHRRSRIRSGYNKVIAAWSGESEERFVARRHVAEGDTVSAGDPLVTIVELRPIDAVIYVSEREYGLLRPGQPATVTTDAYPGQSFAGAIKRIAPEFSERSRQARMELEIENADGELKPGMFVRAQLVLQRIEDATIVPFSALTSRGGETGVFVVNDVGDKVSWVAVEVGIKEGARVQVSVKGGSGGSSGTSEGGTVAITGRVVTLGQQLIDDGAAITIPSSAKPKPEPAARPAP